MNRLFFCFLTAMGLLVSAELPAMRIRGRVQSGDAPLQGVMVSDGYRFTRTDRNGRFRMDTHEDARFVFVVTPAGFTGDFSSGAPQFYLPLQQKTGKYCFNLKKFGEGADYTILSVSDPQMQNDKHLRRFLGRPLEDLCEMADSCSRIRPTVGIALGDLAWNKLEMFGPYKEAIARTGIPFYAVIGNHDFIQNKSGLEAGAGFEAAFGPYNYAFFLGEDLVIAVNDIIFAASGLEDPAKSSNNYKEGYPEESLNFVKGLLELIPADTRIYLAQHSPIRNDGKWIQHADRMLDILAGHRVDILSGHTHEMNVQCISAEVTDHNAAAIGGAWWATDLCRDGTPRGYEIITCLDGTRSWRWHNLDYPDTHQVRFYGLGQTVGHPDAVLANVWHAGPDWEVEWYQDGVYMGAATPVKETDPDYAAEILARYKGNAKRIPGYKKARPKHHFFAAEPSPDATSVVLKVTAPDGRTWQHDFEVGKK